MPISDGVQLESLSSFFLVLPFLRIIAVHNDAIDDDDPCLAASLPVAKHLSLSNILPGRHSIRQHSNPDRPSMFIFRSI
jgi:hypothetical protein